MKVFVFVLASVCYASAGIIGLDDLGGGLGDSLGGNVADGLGGGTGAGGSGPGLASGPAQIIQIENQGLAADSAPALAPIVRTVQVLEAPAQAAPEIINVVRHRTAPAPALKLIRVIEAGPAHGHGATLGHGTSLGHGLGLGGGAGLGHAGGPAQVRVIKILQSAAPAPIHQEQIVRIVRVQATPAISHGHSVHGWD